MQALIICLQGGLYTLYDFEQKKTIKANARGKLRLDDESPKVGDMVEYQMINGEKAYILSIKSRHNNLIRPAISNIDQALILFSVKKPDLNTNLLDRLLAVLEYNNIHAIIIFTKWDLLDSEETIVLSKIINYYETIGYQTIKTSTKTPEKEGFDEIKQLLRNKITVLAGQSGVGKSSLINELSPGLKIRTDVISEALGRGKHTTRHVELIPLFDGWIADTPGFGITNFEGMTEMDLAHSFIDFFKLSSKCKFSCCLHQNEPACAIKNALGNKIMNSRYENYLLFLDEIKKQRKW